MTKKSSEIFGVKWKFFPKKGHSKISSATTFVRLPQTLVFTPWFFLFLFLFLLLFTPTSFFYILPPSFFILPASLFILFLLLSHHHHHHLRHTFQCHSRIIKSRFFNNLYIRFLFNSTT